MAHAHKPDFVFRANGRVHLNRRGRQFSRLLAAEVCASAVVMLDTPCSEVVWRVLATHFIRQFPLHFPTRASPCAIRFQTYSSKEQADVVTLIILWDITANVLLSTAISSVVFILQSIYFRMFSVALKEPGPLPAWRLKKGTNCVIHCYMMCVVDRVT